MSRNRPLGAAAWRSVPEIEGLELADLDAEALVPPRRLGELAEYGPGIGKRR